MTLSIGADPEFFLYNTTSSPSPLDGGLLNMSHQYIPAVGIVPGTKQEPTQLGDGFFCHEDNVTVELGIPPTSEATTFGRYIMEAKKRVSDKFLTPQNYELRALASVVFSAHDLTSAQAKNFGCEPDFDAYTNGEIRKIPEFFKTTHTRYAGGHIHLGGDFNCPPFVAALFADLIITLPSYCIRRGPQFNKRWRDRAMHYGKPGIFRPKPYGIEYRTPTNWWCAEMRDARNMGSSAILLCRTLENTNATDLRKIVRSVPWADVHEFLSEPPFDRKEREEKALMLCNDIGSQTGLPI